MNAASTTHRPVITAGILLGVGLGGFVDGILLHQLLQWHNMLSARILPIDLVSVKVNMVWDGFFHAFTWTMTVIGLATLWYAGTRRDVAWTTRTFVGALVFGWGLFNFVEGLVDHQILGLHHVHPGRGQLAWDLGFLAFGVVEMISGTALMRAGARRPAVPRAGTAGFAPA